MRLRRCVVGWVGCAVLPVCRGADGGLFADEEGVQEGAIVDGDGGVGARLDDDVGAEGVGDGTLAGVDGDHVHAGGGIGGEALAAAAVDNDA